MRRMASILAGSAFVLSAAPAFAGDYELIVQDDAATCCARTGAPAKVVLSSQAVLADLERALTVRGQGLAGYYSNGRAASPTLSSLTRCSLGSPPTAFSGC